MSNHRKSQIKRTKQSRGKLLSYRRNAPSSQRSKKKSIPAAQAPISASPPLIEVDPRQKTSSLCMSMYHSLLDNRLIVMPLNERGKEYYQLLLKYLTQNRTKSPYEEQKAVAAERVFNGDCLDDVAIYDYINFLCNKTDGDMAVIHSGFLPEGVIQPTFCEELKSARERQKTREIYRNAKHLIFPINHGAHWSLMVLSKGEETADHISYSMYCLDSLNHKNAHSAFFTSGEQLLSAIWNDKKLDLPSVKSYRIPEQLGNRDCGVAICYYFARLHHLFKTRQYAGIQFGDFLTPYEEYANAKCIYSKFRSQILKTYHTAHCVRNATAKHAAEKKPASKLHFQFNEPRTVIDLTVSTELILGDDEGEKMSQQKQRARL